MKERPIIMSAESVRAILAGIKTQTRGVIRLNVAWSRPAGANHAVVEGFRNGAIWRWPSHPKCSGVYVPCPYGRVGHRLWVREAWELCDDEGDDRVGIGYMADDIGGKLSDCVWLTCPVGWVYRNTLEGTKRRHDKYSPLVMPRWASRITLEITDVRVQRVQEISEDDCIAEGVDIDFPPHEADQPTPKMLYERLWDSINSKRGYPWASNPWVWAITFKRI